MRSILLLMLCLWQGQLLAKSDGAVLFTASSGFARVDQEARFLRDDNAQLTLQHRNLNDQERRGTYILGGILASGFLLGGLFNGRKKEKKAKKSEH